MKYGVCVAIAYFFPGRVQRLLLPRYARSTLTVRYVMETFFDPYCYVKVRVISESIMCDEQCGGQQ